MLNRALGNVEDRVSGELPTRETRRLDARWSCRFRHATAPGFSWRRGLGLWSSTPATLLVEGGLWLTALVFLARRTARLSFGRRLTYWGGALLITVIWINNVTGPPPPNPSTALSRVWSCSL